jgi:hypothetical protein
MFEKFYSIFSDHGGLQVIETLKTETLAKAGCCTTQLIYHCLVGRLSRLKGISGLFF